MDIKCDQTYRYIAMSIYVTDHNSRDIVHSRIYEKNGNICITCNIVDIKCDQTYRYMAMSIYVTDHNSRDIAHSKDI